MITEATTPSQKVTARHLARKAYLYVRQSTLRQVVENTESTQRQYALRQRALALGWPAEHIIVLDQDLGQSGASAADRAGFQILVAEVGLGRAGIVLGLEVSRLARNSSDWHRLLELCSLTDTLILDEDGLYDPAQFNDRLLLGLKGTMSEAELHVLRARLRGGLVNKARRGELRVRLPVGLVHDPQGRVVLDPDQPIQASVRLLFQTFLRTGTANSVMKHFHDQRLQFPRYVSAGPRKGEVAWEPIDLWRVLSLLKNPRYAGAYAFGRGRWRKRPDGRFQRHRVPREQWLVLLHDAHPGYISWAEHEQIQERLRANAQAFGIDRRHGPPREGPALLQGLVVCGRCGLRMTVRYHRRGAALIPDYLCLRAYHQGQSVCQVLAGAAIDAAVGQLLVAAVNPVAIDVALAVQREIQARLDEADRLRQLHVQRAQYEADTARQRYLHVDPANRLVADALEADWNGKLRALREAQERCQRGREADRQILDVAHREQLRELATDFPALWQDARTPDRERKRMAALLIEDVTLLKDEQIKIHVRFRGGTTTTLTLPLPRPIWQVRTASPQALDKIAELLAQDQTNAQIAATLNAHGFTTGTGQPFGGESVRWLCFTHGLKNLRQRLRDAHWLTTKEIAAQLGVSFDTVKVWRGHGRLRARRCNDKFEWLYAPLDEQPPGAAKKLTPAGPAAGSVESV
jgi:DNA invertase Pin-like site-specific DNA recombinase